MIWCRQRCRYCSVCVFVWPFRCLNKLRFKASSCMNVWIVYVLSFFLFLNFDHFSSVPFRFTVLCFAQLIFHYLIVANTHNVYFIRNILSSCWIFARPNKITKKGFPTCYFSHFLFSTQFKCIYSILKRTLSSFVCWRYCRLQDLLNNARQRIAQEQDDDVHSGITNFLGLFINNLTNFLRNIYVQNVSNWCSRYFAWNY